MDEDFSKIATDITKWFQKHPFMQAKGKIKLSQPCFSSQEVIAVLRVLLLSNGWIAQGPRVEKFEKKFAKYIGVKEAIAVNSGSSANLLALSALLENGNIEVGDEVIIPAAAFPTVATPVIQLGLTPVFVDVGIDGNISPLEIKKAISKKTKIIMVVHTLGNPSNIHEIKSVLKGKNILMFEDCCEAHGAAIEKTKVGSFGVVSSFSFYVAHNMTTGEGGMVVTNNTQLAQITRSLRDFGRHSGSGDRQRFSVYDKVLGNYDTRQLFSRIGYNLRMTDMQAAIGLEQLRKLDKMNKKREKVAEYYLAQLSSLNPYFYLPQKQPSITHVFYGFLLTVKTNAPFTRDEIVKFLEKEGIETRPLFGGCLPDQPAFRKVTKKVIGELPIARLIRDNAFFLGCHPGISYREAEFVVESIKAFIKIKTGVNYR